MNREPLSRAEIDLISRLGSLELIYQLRTELDQWREVGEEIAGRGIPLDLMPRLKALLAKGEQG